MQHVAKESLYLFFFVCVIISGVRLTVWKRDTCLNEATVVLSEVLPCLQFRTMLCDIMALPSVYNEECLTLVKFTQMFYQCSMCCCFGRFDVDTSEAHMTSVNFVSAEGLDLELTTTGLGVYREKQWELRIYYY